MSNHLRQTEDLNRRRRNQAMAQPVWFFAALAIYAVVGGILCFTPVREKLLEIREKAASSKKSSTMTPRQLQDLTERMADLKKVDMLHNVEDIAANLKEFEEIRDQMAANYLEFTEYVAETAADLIDQLLSELEAQQKTALETMESVDPELAKASAVKDAASQDFQTAAESADVRQQEVIKDQIPPLDTIDKALSLAQMAGMKQTAEAIQELLNNQNLAHELQQAARKTNELARTAPQTVQWHQQKLNEEQNNVNRAEQRLAEFQKRQNASAENIVKIQGEIETATAAANDARDKRQQARQQMDEVNAKEEPTAQEKKQAETNLKNTDTAATRADNQLAAQEKKLAEQQAAEQKNAEEVQKLTEALSTARQNLETRKTNLENARQNAANLRRDMTPAQQNAKATQKAAAQLVQAARKTAASEAANPELNAEHFASEPLPDYNQLAKMDTVDLYDTAVRLEGRILETYRDVRATERAILANMSIQNARRLTDVAKTERPEINRELLRSDVRTDAALERHKEALAQAVRETAGIHQSVSTLLDTVRQVAGNHEGFSVESAIDWGQQLDEHAEAVTAEGEENDMADLAEYMRLAMESMGGQYDHPHDGAAPGSHNIPPANNPNAKGGNYHGDPALAGRTPGGNLRFPQGNNLASISRGPQGSGRVPGQYISTGDPRAAMPEQVWGGRTVGAGGTPASWLGLTTWYIIGPFPNPARANIDRKFPPETVVDLDATYEGKNGPIAWQFYQSPFPSMVTPANAEPYGIWYGYSEVRFDQAADLWVAIGSDDKSKIWINDFLIWESAPQHKSWRSNEGFRKVHFRKGVNRILFRCENGHHGMGWSFVINLDPTAK